MRNGKIPRDGSGDEDLKGISALTPAKLEEIGDAGRERLSSERPDFSWEGDRKDRRGPTLWMGDSVGAEVDGSTATKSFELEGEAGCGCSCTDRDNDDFDDEGEDAGRDEVINDRIDDFFDG